MLWEETVLRREASGRRVEPIGTARYSQDEVHQ